MKYLNLTEGFNPFGATDEDLIKFESFFFSGGEPHIKIKESSFDKNKYTDVQVTSRLTSMDDFMMLVIASEALSQIGYIDNKFLFIPYFPGARQDRRMIAGEPLSVKVFADIINDFGYDEVQTFDNHSDVSTALIENCTNTDNHKFVEYCIDSLYEEMEDDDFIIISPDAGANKKAIKLNQFLLKSRETKYEVPDLVKCDKTRNTTNGKITGFEVYADDLKGKDCIIVDDICDGGGTFIGLAEELKKKNAGDLYLIVSHGIFSKPLKSFKPFFKKIYTTDSWRSDFGWEQHERDYTKLVEIVKFRDFR